MPRKAVYFDVLASLVVMLLGGWALKLSELGVVLPLLGEQTRGESGV